MILELDIPDELAREISISTEFLERTVKLLVIIKLVELQRISTGKAAEWLNMSKPKFLLEMSQYNVSAFPVDSQGIKEDIANAYERIC